MIFSALNFFHLLCILHMHDPPCPIFLHRNCTCNAHADAYITIINFHPAFPASTINSSVSYHNACDKQRKTRYKLYHYFQKFVGVRRFRGFWSTFCGLRFKTVRCIVQRSSWSESSPISNMRIFLGQTTVQKGTILSFAISHLPFPLCLNLTGFYRFTTVSRYPAAKFCLWRERENVYAMPSSFAITKYVCSLPFLLLEIY